MDFSLLQNTSIEVLIIVLILLGGLSFFAYTAWKERSNSWLLDTFFLGGRKIGKEKTTHSNWGLTFALSNGVWFFVFAAYQWGPVALLLQIPWCLSFVLLMFVVQPIMTASKNHTIHGFIGSVYGSKARVIACIATVIGYVLNCGYEMYWSSRIFALSTGLDSWALPIALVMTAVCGAYCMIGGFKANSTTDKAQNILGMFGITTLALFLLSGVLAINSTGTNSIALQQAFTSSMPPLIFIVGLTVFGVFFNFFDMANWQTIAANSEVTENEKKGIKRAFLRSAIYMMFFPAAIGVLIGCLLRVYTGLGDDTYFPMAFTHVLGNSHGIIRGLVMGGIMLGLLSTALSSADTYLMAAIHTLSWDLFGNKKYKQITNLAESAPERKTMEHIYVGRARRWMVPLALFMTLVFWAINSVWHSGVVSFQFIMYGSALALAPSVSFALYAQQKKKNVNKHLSFWGTSSILVGILSAVLPFLYVLFTSSEDISSWSPIFALIGSIFVFSLGFIFYRKTAMLTQ